jgi:hypothetical protein
MEDLAVVVNISIVAIILSLTLEIGLELGLEEGFGISWEGVGKGICWRLGSRADERCHDSQSCNAGNNGWEENGLVAHHGEDDWKEKEYWLKIIKLLIRITTD